VQTRSVKTLALVVSLYFFTSNLSGSFLPIYFKDPLGLSVAEIVEIFLFTFMILGLLPFALLKTVRNFERIMSVGIFTTMVFFIVLIFVKNPILLGLAQGISMATFWPSFNLLQFRLSETKSRAQTIGLLSSIIPSLAGIIGPVTGGFIIENLGFDFLFTASIALYLIAFLLSVQIRYKPETSKFSIPKSRTFFIFFTTFVIAGLGEAYWLAYPFFVFEISGTALNMGLVLAATGILLSAVTFSINRLSDIRRTRVGFAIIGATLSAAWCFGISFASSMNQIIALSLLSGFGNAFRTSWFAHYGDSFGGEYYASMLVITETGFMIGRLTNLAPTYVFISQANYASYFVLLGTVLLFLIPLFLMSKKTTT